MTEWLSHPTLHTKYVICQTMLGANGQKISDWSNEQQKLQIFRSL